MPFAQRIGALLCSAFLCAGALGEPPLAPDHPIGTITEARVAHNLSLHQAKQGYPVHLRATVTYFDPYIDSRHAALFVVDSSGGVFVKVPHSLRLSLHAGDLIDLTGITASGDFAPVIDDPHIQVVGTSHLPDHPIKVTRNRLFTGVLDCEWVEFSGIVRAVYSGDNNVTLDIATSQGRVSATTLREAGADYTTMVDSIISIRANAAPVFNRKFQMVGVHAFFPSSHEVRVLTHAPADPFLAPLSSISQLLSFTPSEELVHRMRVQGTVTFAWPGRMLCMQDLGDGICMQTAQTAGIGYGQQVDAIGFPSLNQYKVTLEDANFRLAGPTPDKPQIQPVTPDQALGGDFDAQLVQIDGELIGQDRAAGDLTMMVRSGKSLFSAILPRLAIGLDRSPWKEGSLVRLTGVCDVQVDPVATKHSEGEIRPGSFQILLRSRGDVEVLKVPSWWTREHMLNALVAVGLVGCAAFAWIVILRRRVDQQTRALRASEERLRHMSCHDALTGLPNRVLFNDRVLVALNRAVRFKTSVGILMLDVDHFKDVNDSLGHHAGDQLLCQVAERIRQSIRRTDTVARFGGDEFVVLLTDLQAAKDAEAVASVIISSVSTPMQIDSSDIPITVSVGVCTYPLGGADTETLLRHADAAMYQAKANGRNAFQVYDPAASEDGPEVATTASSTPCGETTDTASC